jgi:hypothetical protein
MYREPAELLLYIMHATHARTHGRTAARPHARTHAHTHARGLARARTHARMHARVVHARSTGSVFDKGSNNKMHARTHTCTHARTHARTHACIHTRTHATNTHKAPLCYERIHFPQLWHWSATAREIFAKIKLNEWREHTMELSHSQHFQAKWVRVGSS